MKLQIKSALLTPYPRSTTPRSPYSSLRMSFERFHSKTRHDAITHSNDDPIATAVQMQQYSILYLDFHLPSQGDRSLLRRRRSSIPGSLYTSHVSVTHRRRLERQGCVSQRPTYDRRVESSSITDSAYVGKGSRCHQGHYLDDLRSTTFSTSAHLLIFGGSSLILYSMRPRVNSVLTRLPY